MKINAPEKIYLPYKDGRLIGIVKTEGVRFSSGVDGHIEYVRKDAFIEKAVEGRVIDDGGEIHLVVPELPIITRNMDDGERVKVLIFK